MSLWLVEKSQRRNISAVVKWLREALNCKFKYGVRPFDYGIGVK